MMGSGSHSLWNMNSTSRPCLRLSSPLLSTSASSSSPSSGFHQYDQNTSSFQNPTAWHDSHELPETWSQLLLGGLEEEEQRICYRPPPTNMNTMVDLNQEISKKAPIPSWGSILSPTSSPGSCITTSLISSSCSATFDFSSSNSDKKSLQQDHSVESNSTSNDESVLKKAKMQHFSALSTLKIRKEKVGDRVALLHQLVSPFGKTDTASVLLEVIGYVRFLQSQIQALSSPYLDNSSRSERQPGETEQSVKDLRSRGLCLVPVSFTLNFGGDDGADYWATSFCGDFK